MAARYSGLVMSAVKDMPGWFPDERPIAVSEVESCLTRSLTYIEIIQGIPMIFEAATLTSEAMTEQPRGTLPILQLSRRHFLGLAVWYAAAMGLLALAEASPHRSLVRPPGAVTEEHFLGSCVRCNVCVDICPVRGIRPAGLLDGFRNVGTPELSGYCTVFKGLENPSAKAALKWKKETRALGQAETCLECIKACPSGALREVGVNQIRMGTAVIDRDLCKAWRYNNCTFDCVDVCPFDAITITAGPVVDETKCVGCNQCNLVCPAGPVRAITVEPNH